MPYPYQSNYGYQNPYQQMPYQPPMQDRLAQLQNQYQQAVPQYAPVQQAQQQMLHLNGQVVDSLDVVKAKDVDLSGAVTYYPKADQSEIYTKQLMADGTSRIVTYKAVPQEQPQQAQAPQTVTTEALNTMFSQLRTDVLNEINAIKDMLPTFVSGTSEAPATKARGGSKA